VADRPLRPATDRRLGRPLPHQLPNRTQAAPKAHHCFGPQPICGISPSFPGLSPTSGYVPTRYSPVRHSHCWACDLHVLSMPPAFTLSQDQTLRFIHHHQAPKDPTATPNHPALTSHRHYPGHPRQPDTKPHHPRHHHSRSNIRAPTAHPTPLQHAKQRTFTKAVSTAIPQPSTQSSNRRPNTKHFQNRFSCQRTTPDQPEVNLR
jgi:hypothetical protein